LNIETDPNRRSDRISLQLPIRVLGTDIHGKKFRAEAVTTLVTRYGGRIALAHELAPDSELMVFYPRRGREAKVRVRPMPGDSPRSFQYGIEVLDPHENLWGIHFPSTRETADAVGRVLLECNSCHAQEVACLDGLALELFQVHRTISRPCKCSAAMTSWGKVRVEAPVELPPNTPLHSSPPASARTLAELQSEGWRIQACVNTEAAGEDLVWTQRPSKDGVRFLSERRYEEKQRVEIALPYEAGGGNVFIPAEIRWSSGEPEGGVILYDAGYLRRVRKATRHAANVTVYVGILGVGLRLTGKIVDLSMTGVLMRTSEKLEPGTNVRMGIEMGVDTFRTVAIMRRVVPGVGIAFEFAQMSQRDRQLLGRLLQSVKASRPG
jgi:hypothetical protein